MTDLNEYFNLVSGGSKFPCSLGNLGGFVNFRNSGKRGSVKEFTLSLESILSGLKDIKTNLNEFSSMNRYVEQNWREIGSKYFTDLTLNSMITVQTKPCFTTFSKIINWANDTDVNEYDDDKIDLSRESLDRTINKIETLALSFSPEKHGLVNKSKAQEFNSSSDMQVISKPFILLAGISGTGKSRFVREQARLSSEDPNSDIKPENYELVSVRPDWHEPSDLLGYVTRLSGKPQFVSTDVLKFMVKAWKAIAPTAEEFQERKFTFRPELKPFWLCLDEMNLAPVEQYFGDYLSVLETRKIEEGIYSCDPLIKSSAFKDLLPSQGSNDYSGVYKLAQDLDLNLDHENDKQLFECFLNHGIPLPYNLIVAGTVNMDETTHGFSRKVIDRALTLDFGEFFPNDFDQYGKNDIQPIALSYPTLTQIESQSLDSDVALQETREFLKKVNEVLKGTMFELAYRALNEALLMVHSFQPDSAEKLCAVWDDFLMMKVLPRIEGDEDKLALVNLESGENLNITVLEKLAAVLNPAQKVEKTDSTDTENPASAPEESTAEDLVENKSLKGLFSKMFAPIWNGQRPDLLREGAGNIECRSKKKIEQMQTKLKRGFTTFWP